MICGGGGVSLIDQSIDIIRQHPNYWLVDQDALNVLFTNDYLQLPPRFNFMLGWSKKYKPTYTVEKNIYHYVLHSLTIQMNDPFSRLWFSYFMKTPFCTPESFERIFKSMYNSTDDKLTAWKKFSQQSQNKKRAFFIHQQNMINIVTNAFGCNNGDIIIKGFNGMQEHKDEFVFIVHIEPQFYQSLKQQLEQLSFVENEHFFNAYEMMSQSYSEDGHDIIKLI